MKTMVTLQIAAMIIFIVSITGIFINVGVGGFGPTNIINEATVQRLYVDRSENDSHYMVGTDVGVFEVNNGILLGIWNSDEIYSQLKEGGKYKLTIKGNRVVNFFFQQYPYIIKVERETLNK
jgi:hypothetical protein